MRIGYGIDPDKTISPRSISFIGGKITRSDLEGCSSPAGFLESGKAAPLRNLKSPDCYPGDQLCKDAGTILHITACSEGGRGVSGTAPNRAFLRGFPTTHFPD